MKSSKKKTNTERKRHPAKTSTERKRHPAKAVKAKPTKKATAKKAKPAPKKVAKYRAPATPRQVQPKAKPAKKTPAKKVAKKAVKAKPANTERKRHPAKATVKYRAIATPRQAYRASATPRQPAPKKVAKKGRSKDSASAPNPSSRRGEKKAKQSSKAVKPSNTERKRHPAKATKKVAKPAKKAKPAKVPVKKARGRPKGTSKDSASAPSLSPALPRRGGRYAPNPSSRRGEKKTAVVAKPAYRANATPRHTERRRHSARAAKAVATPVRPQKRETGALIISKRGRKSKKEREAAAEAQSIFVPRDVKAENTEENQTHDARAYSPDELEQLLMARGVSNMNVFDPKTAITAKVEKKKTQKKIILTTLPKAKKKKTVGPVSVSDLFGFNPFAKNSTSQEEKLIPEKWRKYYRKLMDRKEALLARLNDHSEKAFQKEGKEETGDVSAYSQHTADIDNDAFDRDLALSRLPAEQEELSEINIAIERMKKGTYGICEITGKPIPAERLNKVPFTRYSIEGKLEAEKQRDLAARRRRANATGDISEVIDLENDAPVQLPEEENEEPQ